ncbi:MAG: hypothetical protein K0R09_536 [Clostridiales bacterium]|jgi:outer membrane protein OmpA-like peptidoglycan-associated protein|nr:hypothetical protein [Clostridiales bacterium]
MRGYRLTTLGKVVLFSFLFLLILSTAYTVKAFIYRNGNNNLHITSSKSVFKTQNNNINILDSISIPYANNVDVSVNTAIDELKNTRVTIYFEPDDYLLRNQYYEALDMFANIADVLKDFIIEVEGNCATVYTDVVDNKNNMISYNLSLSRAKSVLNYLQKKGIDPNRIVIIGNGSNKPIKANTTEEERKYNRRVEISFKLKRK